MKTGILAGAFNPVTRAHVALAEAAREIVDEVVCVLPRAYPHKEMHGAALEERVAMLQRAGFNRVEIARGGLFVEIAHELRRPGRELYFICGRDAAERVLHWDYGDPGAVGRMLAEFQLLVASRDGFFEAPPHLRHAIRRLKTPDLDEISSTEVRRRIGAGESWEHLVPESVVEMARAIYSRK